MHCGAQHVIGGEGEDSGLGCCCWRCSPFKPASLLRENRISKTHKSLANGFCLFFNFSFLPPLSLSSSLIFLSSAISCILVISSFFSFSLSLFVFILFLSYLLACVWFCLGVYICHHVFVSQVKPKNNEPANQRQKTEKVEIESTKNQDMTHLRQSLTGKLVNRKSTKVETCRSVSLLYKGCYVSKQGFVWPAVNKRGKHVWSPVLTLSTISTR